MTYYTLGDATGRLWDSSTQIRENIASRLFDETGERKGPSQDEEKDRP